ncbi:hypothetical protein KIH87_02760 [Paraneptunicella aestuarii]|uniref:hypothetical protein n=1 Tax=Paraneptunicella aestuarii TaxID=2831148 RepID=UPI001E376A5A|nr:hypothetical protein [Paraneptunicella aestuarii]UAA39303.1 hypothetical protein KIH87_02760 [Paraneptunicella aestuarii]
MKNEQAWQDPLIKDTFDRVRYNLNKVLTRDIHYLGDNSMDVDFVFPVFHKVTDDMHYVSGIQMTEAIFEGAFLLIAKISELGTFPLNVDKKWLKSQLINWIIARQDVKYKRMILTGQTETLNFTIKDGSVRKIRQQFYCLTQEVKGFVEGEIKIMLPCPQRKIPSESLLEAQQEA